MTRLRRLITATLGVLCLAGCATGDAPEQPGPSGGPHGRGLRYPNTFVSPAGKPYHARFGEPYPVSAWFAAADSDHDGRLTREEMRADAKAFFLELDTNHDGMIDGAEVENYENNIAPEILPPIGRLHEGEGFDANLDLNDQRNTENPRNNARRGGGQARAPRAPKGETTQGAALFSLLNQPEPVSAADTDFNGQVTLAEFLAAADRHFDRLDTKEQGYLTLAGLPKTPVQDAIEQQAKQKARQKGRRSGNVDQPSDPSGDQQPNQP